MSSKRTVRRKAANAVERREGFLALRQQLLQYNPIEDSDTSDVDNENVESASSDAERSDSGSGRSVAHENLGDRGSNVEDDAQIEDVPSNNDDRNSDRDNGQIEGVGNNNNIGVNLADSDSDNGQIWNVGNNNEVNLADSDDSDSDNEREGAARILTEEEKEDYVIESIRQWGTSGGVISMRKIDELLGRLSVVFKKMPKSYKTLLNTAKHLEINDMGDHLMWYYGVAKSLDEYDLAEYLRRKGCVKIDINMDGLPLYKSGTNPRKSKFWPILGKLVGASNEPFVIAIHFGKDPADVDLFLGQFVLEVHDLQNNGYNLDGTLYPFSIRNFICDAPARSLIKCCIGHAGYGACEKCTVVGMYEMHRIHFANVGADCQPRTDESYHNQTDRLHHTGRSPLEHIGIGMVSQFRLDSLHLIYEGAFKRLLEVWMTWDGEWKLTEGEVRDVSDILMMLKDTCPDDFNRKSRILEEWAKYKAKDYRRMVLYEGVVAFQKLDKPLYEQYLLLHCAVYILANPYFLELYSDDAQTFIDAFVDHAIEVYGNHFVVYNVHSLRHIVDECRDNGELDSFGAFSYENKLKTIKQTLKSGYLPLHQIAKRRSEKTGKIPVVMEDADNSVKLLHPHVDPDEEQAGDQYKEINVNNVTLKIGQRDCGFMTNEGHVFILKNVLSQGENSVTLVGNRFTSSADCYTYPMNSSLLGIVKVWDLNDDRETVPLEDVFCKCWIMKNGDHFVSVPLFAVVKTAEPGSDNEEEEKTFFEAVSVKWLELDEETNTYSCYWPRGVTDTEVAKMVRKHVEPSKDDSWKCVPCDVMSTYDTYLEAHLGAKNRVDNSSYETEKEMGRGCRRRTSKKLSSDEDEPTESSIVAPRRVKTKAAGQGFKVHKSVHKSPVKVVKCTTAQSQQSVQNEKILKMVRKDRGTKASGLEELRARLIQKQEEMKTKKLELLSVKSTSPNWKASKMSENCDNEEQMFQGENIRSPQSMPEKGDVELYQEIVSNNNNDDKYVIEDHNADGETYIFTDSPENECLGEAEPNLLSETSMGEESVEKEVPTFQQIKNNLKLIKLHSPKGTSKDTVKRTLTFSPRKPVRDDNQSSQKNHYSDFEREVLRLLREINARAENALCALASLKLHLLPNEKVLKKPKGMPTIPLGSLELVQTMEQFLEDDDNLAYTSIYLSSFVSKDPTKEKQSAMKIMPQIFSNYVGCHFNFCGQRDKNGFENLYLWRAVQGAISLKLDASDFSEAQKGVQSWLKDSSKRLQSEMGRTSQPQVQSKNSSKTPNLKNVASRKSPTEPGGSSQNFKVPGKGCSSIGRTLKTVKAPIVHIK